VVIHYQLDELGRVPKVLNFVQEDEIATAEVSAFGSKELEKVLLHPIPLKTAFTRATSSLGLKGFTT